MFDKDEGVTQVHIVSAAETFARSELLFDPSGHDFWHVDRVRRMALKLAVQEGADLFLTEIIALLHDIRDVKVSGLGTAGGEAAWAFCIQHGLSKDIALSVSTSVHYLSYRGGGVADVALSLEGSCVRDADRLDAIGAIGIARAVAYGATRNRSIWDPSEVPILHADEESYRSNKNSSITHFFEKLLLLRNRMSTNSGRSEAEGRHAFMLMYLREFFEEWGIASPQELSEWN